MNRLTDFLTRLFYRLAWKFFKRDADLPGGLYDKIYNWAADTGHLPTTPEGRRRLSNSLLVGSATVEELFGNGHIGRFMQQLSDDWNTKMAKRILTGTQARPIT